MSNLITYSLNTIIMSIPTYIIFAGDGYYPCGGFHDLYGFAETFKEALVIYDEALTIGSKPRLYCSWDATYIGDKETSQKPRRRSWAHIVNLKTQKIVAKKSGF